MQQQQMRPLPPALRAATVSRKGPPPPILSSSSSATSRSGAGGTKPSRFAAQRVAAAAAAAAGTTPCDRGSDGAHAAADGDDIEAPALVAAVVGDIVERPTVAPAEMPTAPAGRPTMTPSPWTAPRGGFPRVAHRSLAATTTTTTTAAVSPYGDVSTTAMMGGDNPNSLDEASDESGKDFKEHL